MLWRIWHNWQQYPIQSQQHRLQDHCQTFPYIRYGCLPIESISILYDSSMGVIYISATCTYALSLQFLFDTRHANNIHLLISRKVDYVLEIGCCRKSRTENLILWYNICVKSNVSHVALETYQRSLDAKTLELAKESRTRLGAIVGNEEDSLS